jgi:regulator of sigma E protease
VIEFVFERIESVATFFVIISVLVFVHEMGHYLVARWAGIRVEVFSIGFGHELYGWDDRHGTRWKIASIPIGGYVKFFGDANAASAAGDGVGSMTAAERAVNFHHKPLRHRAAVVVAGPLANFLFAIILFAGIFSIVGQPFTAPVVSEVISDSPAERAGLMAGDRILEVGGATIRRFEDLQRLVQLRPGEELEIVVRRDELELMLKATPELIVETDQFGNVLRIGRLGVRSSSVEFVRHDPLSAIWAGTRATIDIVSTTFVALRQMIVGTRGTTDLAGPIGIAQMSGQVAQLGVIAAIQFAAFLSVSLGLINLFPVPILDGGHLLFYIIEGLRGRPLSARAQGISLRFGLILVLALIVFTTFNDLNRLNIFGYVTGLFS